ncbi:hypothetical protein GCM10009000_035820 [Halobacterium noricense]
MIVLREERVSSDESRDPDADETESDLGALRDIAQDVDGGEEGRDTDTTPDGESRSRTLSDLAESIDRRTGGEPNRTDHADPDGYAMDDWDAVDSPETGGVSSSAEDTIATLLELVGDIPNVLVKGPEGAVIEDILCSRLLAGRSGEPIDVVLVAINESPLQRLSILRNYLPVEIGELTVIHVPMYSDRVSAGEFDRSVNVQRVSDPTDLRRIGILISRTIADWMDSTNETAVCMHSLSELLEASTEHQRIFRFLHVLTGRISTANARAQYHLDPSRHTTETIGTFASLFEATVEYDEDGDVSLE